jgi:hypothetical protein
MDAVPGPGEGNALLAGRYDVGALVGLGGTAQVYRAWDHQGGCPVAVKIFRPGSAPAPGYGGARELAMLTGVRHAGLVGVRGAGVDPQGCPFVVMDLVDGDSLSARLHDGPLTPAAVARVGAVLADALAVVHDRGIVHRDVKPANVLLDTDGHPWLTDFGIARLVDATRVTATGVVVGTAAYMAPEQVRGEAVGPPADVYALGLVLLEAVTGRREYEGGALESALARLHRAPVVPPGLPDPLGATLRRMTATRPEDRPTAAEVTAALRHRQGGPRPAGEAPHRTRTAAGRVGRRVAPVAALACLVAGALVGALSLAGPERPAEEPRAVLVPAAAPAPKPVPVALRSPDRTPRTGTRTAPRVEVRSGSDRDEDSDRRGSGDAKDDAEDDAPRKADRDRDRDEHDATDGKADDDDRDDGGGGDSDDRKGSGKGKGKGGGGGDHSGSGSDDG